MDFDKRTEKLIGKNNIDAIRNKKVLIVGLGGVGGIAFETLVRMGFLNIFVADFDTFEESNLNRQILSNLDDIGMLKINAAVKKATLINKECKITCYKKIDEETLKNIDRDFDYIIDACDDVNAKVLLVKFAISNNIKIICSCGMGNRLHPEMLFITDIWKTENDPLAKTFRKKLKEAGISCKLPVVVSKELPVIKTSDYVGSCFLVPNAAGILLASYVINDVIEESK